MKYIQNLYIRRSAIANYVDTVGRKNMSKINSENKGRQPLGRVSLNQSFYLNASCV